MPKKHPSVRKRHRQSLVRRGRNRTAKSRIRSAMKDVVAAGVEDKLTTFRTASSVVDNAAARGVIHKNKAARIKSRLSRRIKTVG